MIRLHHEATPDGEVEVVLHVADGSVSYRKHGFTQTWFDAHGENLAEFIDAAVQVLLSGAPKRVLVLGHGGGAASALLDRAGVEVIAVDRDPAAERLGRLYFGAPPHLQVQVEDAAGYVKRAETAAFDGVLVDFQDSSTAPEAYLDAGFWRAIVRLLRPCGLTVLNVPEPLTEEPTWTTARAAIKAGGFAATVLTEAYASGNRLLVAETARG